MDTDDDPRTLYPFELFDPVKTRWRVALRKATRSDIEARGGRITGPGWLPPPSGQFTLRDDEGR
jgi:hypothetical protein